jgi:hypothetical protein
MELFAGSGHILGNLQDPTRSGTSFRIGHNYIKVPEQKLAVKGSFKTFFFLLKQVVF